MLLRCEQMLDVCWSRLLSLSTLLSLAFVVEQYLNIKSDLNGKYMQKSDALGYYVMH